MKIYSITDSLIFLHHNCERQIWLDLKKASAPLSPTGWEESSLSPRSLFNIWWHAVANVSNRVLQNYIMWGQDIRELSIQVWWRYKCIYGVFFWCVCGFADGLTSQAGASVLPPWPALLWTSLGHWDNQQLRWDTLWRHAGKTSGKKHPHHQLVREISLCSWDRALVFSKIGFKKRINWRFLDGFEGCV